MDIMNTNVTIKNDKTKKNDIQIYILKVITNTTSTITNSRINNIKCCKNHK